MGTKDKNLRISTESANRNSLSCRESITITILAPKIKYKGQHITIQYSFAPINAEILSKNGWHLQMTQ